MGDGLQSGRGLTMAPGPVRDENLAEEAYRDANGLKAGALETRPDCR